MSDCGPGPSSDVCIVKASPTATGKIDIHSLQVAAGTSVDFGANATSSASVTISDVLINHGDVSLTGTLSAPTIDNTFVLGNDGFPTKHGDATITSPALSSSGGISALFGTLRLTDNPQQLQAGTFTGGDLQTIDGTLIINGDITSIAAGEIQNAQGEVEDEHGANALASLASIGSERHIRRPSSRERQPRQQRPPHSRGSRLVDPRLFHPDRQRDLQRTLRNRAAHRRDRHSRRGARAADHARLSAAGRRRRDSDDLRGSVGHVRLIVKSSFKFNVLYGPNSVSVQYEGPPLCG